MAEKTEAPTSTRISKAREEGQVARSVELNSAAILLMGMLLLQSLGKTLVGNIQTILVSAIHSISQTELTTAWLEETAINDVSLVGPTLLIIMAGLMVSGVLITLLQTRFMWSGKKIGFQFNRLNPLNNLKRFVTPQGLIELGRALIKLGVVGWVAYSFVQEKMETLLQLGQTDLYNGLNAWIDLAFALGIRVGAVYLVVAIVDYIYQRWTYLRGLRMTKDEIKEEYKQQEGDPALKGRIRQQARKIARMRMMSNVPKASVVITNPTHLAIAIQYDQASMAAPRVVAKGANLVAFRIADIAREHHVPVVQNIPLARAIYRTVEIEQEIPPELYAAMAEILVYVYRLKGQQPAFAHS